ncbi:hypothetical protein PIB30_045902 [Stylosanthes scabra]|uniref:Homeobox domain-containing protein n=1 Tax=Stylosanthes scabra TaxID=79078 RepID=A0ABU6VFM7_9FABA|nr:hypothetical protein [Stylosanthes scabra]
MRPSPPRSCVAPPRARHTHTHHRLSASVSHCPFLRRAAGATTFKPSRIFEEIGINVQFPEPILIVTTNWNVAVNVENDIDEPLLLTCFFKECPHPDEKQRLELSKRLVLENKQVKFWFQNWRTQMKL